MERNIQPAAIRIRTQAQPGDLGYIAYLHGRLYARECGYGLPFEKYVLQGLAELTTFRPDQDCIWICEDKDRIVGCVAGVLQPDGFQLRFFLLEPAYRSLGLGKKLLQLFIGFMKEKGYTHSFLWTTNEQIQAAALYRQFGFRLTEEKASTAFGKPLVEQRFDLSLV